jgi:hypothetical protein
LSATGDPPTAAAVRNAGVTPSPSSSLCKANMPVGSRRCLKPLATATGEALQAILDFDLDELAAIEPPRGFGRD